MDKGFEALTRIIAGGRLTRVGIAKPDRRSFLGRAAAGLGSLALLGSRGALAGGAEGKSGGSGDVAAEGERAGRQSHREGIETWRVHRRPGGYEVNFRHKIRRRSGTLDITFGGGSMSYILTRDRDQLRLAFSKSGNVSVVDTKGRSATASWDRQRRRWKLSEASNRILRGSRRDFRLGLAIASDLDPDVPKRRASGSARQSTTASDCSEVYLKGSGFPRPPIYTRSVACDIATKDLEDFCYNVTNCGSSEKSCCRVLPECDCFCLSPLEADYLCGCDRVGNPYPYYCA